MSRKNIFIVATYVMRPKNKNKTSTAGWMNNPDNIIYDEQIAIARGLKTKDLTYAKVILDLTERTVVRNTWKSEKTFDDLFEYFYNGYPTYLQPVIAELGYEFVDINSEAAQAALVDEAKSTELNSSYESAIPTTV